MAFEFEYFWAILLLFIMERICCLQEQYERDFLELPVGEELGRSFDSITSAADIEEFAIRDVNLKLSFLRLGQLVHVLMMLSIIYFCNSCLWFMMARPAPPPKVLRFRFQTRPLLKTLGSHLN